MELTNLTNKFFNKIPEIKNSYLKKQEENMIDDNDGIYVVWAMGLMPCVLKLLCEDKKNTVTLEKIFDYFEDMANSDEEIKEILMYSVLEKIGDDKDILEKSKQYMKSETLILSSEVENFLGR